jgi:hypothetical protein
MIDFISKDVDEAFEEWTKQPFWKAFVEHGLSLEDKKKDFYCQHNYYWNKLSKLGCKPGDEIPIDEFHRIAGKLFDDYSKAFENIPLNTCLEYLAEEENKPLDELRVKDLDRATFAGVGLMFALRDSIPFHLVMSYLPEEDTI